jgi:hypothetical protein
VSRFSIFCKFTRVKFVDLCKARDPLPKKDPQAPFRTIHHLTIIEPPPPPSKSPICYHKLFSLPPASNRNRRPPLPSFHHSQSTGPQEAFPTSSPVLLGQRALIQPVQRCRASRLVKTYIYHRGQGVPSSCLFKCLNEANYHSAGTSHRLS